VPGLTPSILKGFEIELPSIEKQRAIEKASRFGKETNRT